jgi:hypothetical protein
LIWIASARLHRADWRSGPVGRTDQFAYLAATMNELAKLAAGNATSIDAVTLKKTINDNSKSKHYFSQRQLYCSFAHCHY